MNPKKIKFYGQTKWHLPKSEFKDYNSFWTKVNLKQVFQVLMSDKDLNIFLTDWLDSQSGAVNFINNDTHLGGLVTRRSKVNQSFKLVWWSRFSSWVLYFSPVFPDRKVYISLRRFVMKLLTWTQLCMSWLLLVIS